MYGVGFRLAVDNAAISRASAQVLLCGAPADSVFLCRALRGNIDG